MTFDKATIDSWSDEEVARFKQKRPPARLGLEALGRPSVVAEGDSWFDYLPGTDVIDCLRLFHGFEIENHAKAGDTLENMIFGGRSAAFLSAVKDLKPKALLFSAGGNDVAGDSFGGYLNHRQSGLPLVRQDVMVHMIDTVFERYFRHLIDAVKAASPATAIVTHGYGHTRPTGKGVVNFFGFHFVGPWLLPALKSKAIDDRDKQFDCVVQLMDRYNAMLARLSQQNPRFRYVDLRPIIDADSDWANELHLKNSAYMRVAAKIAEVVQSL